MLCSHSTHHNTFAPKPRVLLAAPAGSTSRGGPVLCCQQRCFCSVSPARYVSPPLIANLRKKHRDACLYNFTEAEAAQHSTRWHLHAARHAWLQAEDLEEREEIPAYALSELNVKYKAPLRSQDWYIVTVGIKEYTRTRVVCAQRVIRLDPESEQADRVRH